MGSFSIVTGYQHFQSGTLMPVGEKGSIPLPSDCDATMAHHDDDAYPCLTEQVITGLPQKNGPDMPTLSVGKSEINLFCFGVWLVPIQQEPNPAGQAILARALFPDRSSPYW